MGWPLEISECPHGTYGSCVHCKQEREYVALIKKLEKRVARLLTEHKRLKMLGANVRQDIFAPPPEARSYLPSAIAWVKSLGPGPWVGIAVWLEELAERRGIPKNEEI